MEPQILKIAHFTAEELKSLLSEDPAFRQAVRLFACYHIALGKQPDEVASFYGTPTAVIAGWVRQLNDGGIEELAYDSREGLSSATGEGPQLSLMQVIRYRQPADYGFHKKHWNFSSLAKLLLYETQAAYRFAQLCHFFQRPGSQAGRSR